MTIIELTKNHFNNQFLSSFQNDVVIVLYYADWCYYCKEFKPIYKELETKIRKKVICTQINIEKEKELIEKNNKFLYGVKIKSYPTIVIYKKGNIIKKYNGSRDINSLIKEISQHL